MITSHLPLPDQDLNLAEARRLLSTLVIHAEFSRKPVYLARRGHRVAAIIDARELERLMELAEDMEDILAAEDARREMVETGETPVPWEQVKADLGLTGA